MRPPPPPPPDGDDSKLGDWLDARAGRVMRISEQQSGWFPPPMPMANAMAFRGAGGEAADLGAPTFALGQITISATVNITFELE